MTDAPEPDTPLARHRHAQGWSQGDIASEVGVSRQAVGELESGKHAPTVTTIIRYAPSYGLDPGEMFNLLVSGIEERQ